jgi:catechol 2,3-dioxygenase-like lactoylglutathione lyase family enzyme
MPTLDMTILYVSDPLASAGFYEEVLGCAPVEKSPGFALFVLPNGTKLGLWKGADVEPRTPTGKGGEICFALTDADAVRTMHAAWSKRMSIAQTPTEMDFGYTFVGLDPDGYRLRAFSPSRR